MQSVHATDQASHMRPPNPKVDPDAPAARIAAKFDKNGNPRASALAKAIGKSPSTVQRWIEGGHIPPESHGDVVDAGRRLKIVIRPDDFVDARAFAKPSLSASLESVNA